MIITDQIGRKIEINQPIERIISIVPSITELLADLHLKDRMVARTKFCIYPDHITDLAKIGGTKQVDVEKIRALNPDFIIANKEENTQEIVDTLSAICPVYVSNVQSVHGALDLILHLGQILDVESSANSLVNRIEEQREAWHKENISKPLQCIYLIWKDPLMSIGPDTFIYQMMQACNLQSVVQELRYPSLDPKDIEASSATHILLSSEPYPFQEKHIKDFQTQFPDKKIILVDGTYFSWYGSRLEHSYMYFKQLKEILL